MTLQEALAELNLDADFAALPDNWKSEIAQIAISQGLGAAAKEMSSRAVAEGQDPSFADARAALGRWAAKADQNAQVVDTGGTTLPLEQDILNQYLGGLLSDADHDTVRRELVAKLGEQAVSDFESARNAISPEENARRLAEELAQADATGARISGSADTSADAQRKALGDSIAAMQANLTAQLASLRGATDANSIARSAALQKELDQLNAAQQPLSQARLDSANALASGINLGLESTKDQLTATRAKQGYLGGSTFDDAALARATIGARQGAAQALGNARELNATDTRQIAGLGATEGRSIADQLAALNLGIDTQGATDTRTLGDTLARGTGQIGMTLAQQQQAARDAATAARQGYFDNAYTRGQGGILTRASLGNNLVGTLNGLDAYGNTGLNRLLNTLTWWQTGGQQAPTTATVPVTADNSGNDLAGLGAGILGAGLKVGAQNNFWQTPTSKNGIPVVNTPNNPSTTNWWTTPATTEYV